MNVTVTSDVSGLTTEQTVNATVRLAGDANGDGIVNILDKVIIGARFGPLRLFLRIAGKRRT